MGRQNDNLWFGEKVSLFPIVPTITWRVVW